MCVSGDEICNQSVNWGTGQKLNRNLLIIYTVEFHSMNQSQPDTEAALKFISDIIFQSRPSSYLLLDNHFIFDGTLKYFCYILISSQQNKMRFYFFLFKTYLGKS